MFPRVLDSYRPLKIHSEFHRHVLAFEVPSEAFEDLPERLDVVGVHVDAPPRDALRARGGDAVVPGSLVIRFLAPEPDRRVVSPAVPG